MIRIKEKLKTNERLKSLAHFLLKPKNDYRPRWWVRFFLNRFVHKKGKASTIRRRTRLDLFPYNSFHLGNESIIEDFATLNNAVGDLYIGHRTLIGIGCVLIGPIVIGDDVMLAQNVVLSGLNHNYKDISLPISKQSYTIKEISVGTSSWIGANVVITAGVKIGKHCVIAAGSVVTKDVPDYSVAAGNPAKVLKGYNFETKEWESFKKLKCINIHSKGKQRDDYKTAFKSPLE